MAVPPWKLALLERKKKQEEEEKNKQAKEEEAKIASLPAWKRAILMREKQGKPISATTTTSETNPKWQVAVERVKGADSPILNQRPSWKNAPKSSIAAPPPSSLAQGAPPSSPKPIMKSTDSPVLSRWKHISTASEGSKKEAPKRLTASQSFSVRASSTPMNSSSVREAPATYSSSSSGSSTPAGSNSSSVRTTSATSNSSSVRPTPPSNSSSVRTTPSAPLSTNVSEEDDDPSLAKLPAWKKALILKKRKAQKTANEETVVPAIEDKPPDPVLNSNNEKDVSVGAEIKVGPRQPEVVNRSTGEGVQRLVEQEGKTLHPPVFKEVDEWANVQEEDAKFKALPPWKQALIRRRREDFAKRSGLPVPTATTSSSDPEPQASPLVKKPNQTTKKTNNKKVHVTQTNATENKKIQKTVSHERKKKFTADKQGHRHGKDQPDTGKPVSKTASKSVTKTVTKPTTKPATKPATKPTTKPTTKAPAPPAKKEELTFSYSFSKSSRRTLDTGDSSSDATDSDLEDAVITNLDDESDEDDSGIVLQSYSVSNTSSQPSPTLKDKSISDSSMKKVKSAVSTAGKKKHMRRVSWSDTQLVSEHYYPKYDYSDYDDIEREEDNKSRFMAALAKENSGLSHRLHPSLRRNNDTDGYGYGGFTPTSPSSRNATENSLGSFVPKTLSGHSPQMYSGYTDPEVKPDEAEQNGLQEELETVQEQTDDFYADFSSSNTAALLW